MVSLLFPSLVPGESEARNRSGKLIRSNANACSPRLSPAFDCLKTLPDQGQKRVTTEQDAGLWRIRGWFSRAQDWMERESKVLPVRIRRGIVLHADVGTADDNRHASVPRSPPCSAAILCTTPEAPGWNPPIITVCEGP